MWPMQLLPSCAFCPFSHGSFSLLNIGPAPTILLRGCWLLHCCTLSVFLALASFGPSSVALRFRAPFPYTPLPSALPHLPPSAPSPCALSGRLSIPLSATCPSCGLWAAVDWLTASLRTVCLRAGPPLVGPDPRLPSLCCCRCPTCIPATSGIGSGTGPASGLSAGWLALAPPPASSLHPTAWASLGTHLELVGVHAGGPVID